MVLKTGFAITVAPVVTFRPAAGAQLNVFAVPVAVIVSGVHLLLGVTEIVGAGFTVNVAADEFTLPHGDVTTARYERPLIAVVAPVMVNVFVVTPE